MEKEKSIQTISTPKINHPPQNTKKTKDIGGLVQK
jgi:hypothetical protein